MRPMTGTGAPGRRLRLAVIAGLVALALGVGPLAQPGPVAAATAGGMERSLLALINADRQELGLVPLRNHPGLRQLAGDRAATMASTGVLKHPNCLSCLLNARGIQWYMNGEVIAWTSWPWGSQAVQSLYNAWKGSSDHWSLLMSDRFNYAGVGVAYRRANGTTWASIVLTESKDRTNPWARMTSGSRSGDDVTFTWTGADRLLQTHTAGLRNFDVQLRRDSGSWRTIRTGITATSLTLWNRAGGHWYKLRVRARDERGNVSGWTKQIRVWVP